MLPAKNFPSWLLIYIDEEKDLMNGPRVCLIVIDGVGIGPAPDAADYGDSGANTLGHIWERIHGLDIPNLLSMGMGALLPGFIPNPPAATGSYGKMIETSAGKDTTTGHWELAGLITEVPSPTFPCGFPMELIKKFERLTGRRCIGNKAASGTQIIEELGPLHRATGRPIVYTSADSVFQIAAHIETIPVEELYRMCLSAREVLTGPWSVSRVIARPFAGEPGSYVRTDQRRDFTIPPHGKTILDSVADSGLEVVGIGKIEDIFAGRGLTRSIHTHDNADGIRVVIEEFKENFSGLMFVNLVDFDMKYGHRRDVAGFAGALEEFDRALPSITAAMGERDSLLVTSDHGNDPTHHGTDHTREVVPVLGLGRGFSPGRPLGTRTSFADAAATIAGLLSVPLVGPGKPFLI